MGSEQKSEMRQTFFEARDAHAALTPREKPAASRRLSRTVHLFDPEGTAW